MPRDANGVYSLPEIYRAVTGTTIIAAQHNGPLEDIQQALTDSLPRSGVAPMTGPLKLADGDAASPALRFNSVTGRGLFKTTDGIGFAVGGQKVVEITANGLIGLPIGTPIPVLDDTLPGLCIWADGRNVSRTTYAALFAKWAAKYGAGDGSTTFGMPDLRGRALAGRDNLGGTDASRLASVPAVSGDRLTTGGILGAAQHTLLLSQIPWHNHAGATTSAGLHNHGYYDRSGDQQVGGGGALLAWSGLPYDTYRGTDYAGDHVHGIYGEGDGGAHNNVQPTMLCNFAIYAGA